MAIDVGPFDIESAIARLKAQVPAFRNVEGAAELAAARQAATVVTPGAFVLLGNESGSKPTPASELTIQECTARFGVVLAVQNFRVSQLGTAGKTQLAALIKATRVGLIGWRVPDFETRRAVRWASGALLANTAATVWWQEIFEFTYWSRS